MKRWTDVYFRYVKDNLRNKIKTTGTEISDTKGLHVYTQHVSQTKVHISAGSLLNTYKNNAHRVRTDTHIISCVHYACITNYASSFYRRTIIKLFH